MGIDMRTPKKMHLDMVMDGFDDDRLISFIFAIACTVYIYIYISYICV